MMWFIIGVVALVLVIKYWNRATGWLDNELDENKSIRKAEHKKALKKADVKADIIRAKGELKLYKHKAKLDAYLAQALKAKQEYENGK